MAPTPAGCEICKGIDNGSMLDVVEMDAASNNGVDDIRDLRDETAYTPSACQYKVYIIDEVHMLSTAAFNALLKTLEEPPAHVIFILATTEIQKVPATIFPLPAVRFYPHRADDIAQRVEYIAGEEKLELTSDGCGADLAAWPMVRCVTHSPFWTPAPASPQKLTRSIVRRMAGVTDRSYLFHISDAWKHMIPHRAGTAGRTAAAVGGYARLTEELIAHYRALMLAALPGGRALLSGVSPEERTLYLQKGPQGQREAIRAITPLGTALEHMTRGSDQRIELELALFSLAEPPQAGAAPHRSSSSRQPLSLAAAPVQPFAAPQVQFTAAPPGSGTGACPCRCAAEAAVAGTSPPLRRSCRPMPRNRR